MGSNSSLNNNQKILPSNLAKKLQHNTLDKFYNDYAAAYYGEIKRSLHRKDICDQTLIDAFKKFSSSIGEYDSTKERVFTWCLKIVRKEIRKKKIDLLLKEIFACQQHTGNKEVMFANMSL
jgi:hypothetical protein